MATGKVKVITGKGYGFIETSDSPKDVFYHESSLNGLVLNVGDLITFDIEEGPKGPAAVNIKLAE